MYSKDFSKNSKEVETQNNIVYPEKSLNSGQIKSNRVDINVLKSKLEDEKNKELRKNIIIFSISVLFLGIIGIYLSL
tara:strand:- start:1553 stop:1783 length:231 start_codon:yes stop_codon:yes gene_type:complete